MMQVLGKTNGTVSDYHMFWLRISSIKGKKKIIIREQKNQKQ